MKDICLVLLFGFNLAISKYFLVETENNTKPQKSKYFLIETGNVTKPPTTTEAEDCHNSECEGSADQL